MTSAFTACSTTSICSEAGIEAAPTNAEEFLEAARLLTVDANGLHPG
ncbi:MAG: hypothetical protein HND48_02670 [Chloroflexi bacterium]|nr:hypothetical protein [Chloroflexota bacterium]